MKLYQVLDQVRENVGRDKLSEPALRYAIERGLRRIEQQDNFYWMAASKLFPIYDGQQDYSIKDDLDIEDYKDANYLLASDRTATDPDWFEVVGPEPIASSKLNFAEGDEGAPAFWSLKEEGDPTILLWPPNPEQDFRGELHYFKWTTLPEATTSENHEVLRRWPDALIFTATAEGILLATKDIEQAQFWELRFYNPANPQVSTEYKKIKLYEAQRKQAKRFRNEASSGSTTMTNKLRQAQKIWF